MRPSEEGRARNSIDRQESPRTLSENEWQWECKERIKLKRNTVVRGIRAEGNGNEVARSIKPMIREKLGVNPKNHQSAAYGWWTSSYVAVHASENCNNEKKAQLGGIKIWIENDHTARKRGIGE